MARTRRATASKFGMLAAIGILAGCLQGIDVAHAADLGGNCCADLEERIAELEATTARKGTRKVSLELGGWINEAIMAWDDGFESNQYLVTNDSGRSRFRFKGEAKIDGDWKVGYLMEVGVRTANSKRFTQDNPKGNDNPADTGLDLRHKNWFITNKHYGRLTVGQASGPAEGISELNLSQTRDIVKYADPEDMGLGLALRQKNGLFSNGETKVVGATTAFTWRRLLRDNGDQPGEGRRYTLARYDAPELMGFKASASWGEDDVWEVGGRYEGELSGFKIAAGIAYGENTELKTATGQVGFECLAQSAAGIPVGSGTDARCHQIGASVSVMHVESGLYVNFGAGRLTDDLVKTRSGAANPSDNISEFWAMEGGIEKKWNSLGKTTIYGQYFKDEGGTNTRRDFDGSTFTVGAANNIVNTELEGFGFGVIQGVEAASVQFYLSYNHFEADVTLRGLPKPELEDLEVVTAGALLKF